MSGMSMGAWGRRSAISSRCASKSRRRTDNMRAARHRRGSQCESFAAVEAPGESGEASCGEEACEEVVVPCGDFAFEAQ